MKKKSVNELEGLPHAALWAEFWAEPDSEEALCRLLEALVPFAQRIVARMAIRLPSYVERENLFYSALLGLHDAIHRFDPESGQSFEAFAYRRVRGAILDELRARDPLSRSQRNTLKRVESTIREWAQEHGAFPDEDELAEATGLGARNLRALFDRALPWLSLDAPVGANGDRNLTLGEVLADPHAATPDQETQKEDLRRSLRHAFRQLAPREQKILYLYYYEELRLHEIAALYEVTEARICQIHALAVAKLKSILSETEK
ncbi:MAG: FliA/WhiG family RNA polymerase sigma factor [Kiritimatiellae bacterium]|nr:FliA/WhiG family RNA polymerase sigma factor [Kiritimatiellia bacterium]